MLEDRWRSVVARFRNDLAVHEVATGRSWTFAELATAADSLPVSPAPILFPSGTSVGFLLTVLQAWRHGRILCPLEAHQAVPELPTPTAPIAHLKFTSGSSGRPRAVALTEAQITADADQIVRTMRLDPSQPNLGVLSLAHSYGYSNLVTPLLLHGIPLILAPSALPAAMLAAAANHGPLTLPGVPALWRMWHEAESIPSNVRLAISAGAPLPHALERDVLERRGLKIHNFLGASECGGIAFDRSEDLRPDGTEVGTAMDDVQISTSEEGCLVVRSPAVAECYWPQPEPSLRDGRYQSTDLISIDSNGVLRIQGRAGDVINVAGRKVTPDVIEQALLHHPAVADCLAVGIPDDNGRGEAIGIAYVLRSPASESDLRAFLTRTLPAWQLPRKWWARPDLGVDGRGKRSRIEWRRRLLAGD